MAKNREDWAIVVGMQDYPDPAFGNLLAPENDARAFHQWLVSKTGGNLLKRNAKLILSSNYKQPFKNARSAKPAVEQIEQEFEKLDAIAETNNDQGLGRRVGRRLYLYFAGHGCAPSSPASKESLLLTANATSIYLGHNVPGKMYADLYVFSGYFEEVVLIMDCCRDILAAAPIRPPARKLTTHPNAIANGKIFVGYATKWSRRAREKPINGQWQGVFTKALLDGLSGGASNPVDGRITADSLRNYLYNSWRNYFTEQDWTDPTIPKEPEVWFDPQNPTTGDSLVFAKLPVPTYAVNVSFPAELEGERVNVLDSTFQVVESTIVGANPWQINLKKGKYILLANAIAFHPFDVLGIGDINVNVNAHGATLLGGTP